MRFKDFLKEQMPTGSNIPQGTAQVAPGAAAANPTAQNQQMIDAQKLAAQQTQNMTQNSLVQRQIDTKRGELMRLNDQLAQVQKLVMAKQKELDQLEMTKK